jgi:hypothetical protein
MDNTFTFHSRPDSPIRSTIVGRLNQDTGEICIAASRCGKNDSFNKKKGRQIATGRLLKGKCLASAQVQPNESPIATFVALAHATSTYLISHAKPVPTHA